MICSRAIILSAQLEGFNHHHLTAQTLSLWYTIYVENVAGVLSWDYDNHPGRSPLCVMSTGGWPGSVWRSHIMHAVYVRASVKHSKSRSMKLIGYSCPSPYCNKLWTLEEVCTMLEERKKEYWWEVDEEEKEYHTKLEPSISSS